MQAFWWIRLLLVALYSMILLVTYRRVTEKVANLLKLC